MKIQLQENDVEIVRLGDSVEENGVAKRTVTFSVSGKEFDREIILGPNGTGEDYDDAEKFYIRNQQQVDTSLINYFSENHLYENK